jgi:hypothetical protein
LLAAVSRPHPVASSFSSVLGEYRVHAPFGQYAPYTLRGFSQHLTFATGGHMLVQLSIPHSRLPYFGRCRKPWHSLKPTHCPYKRGLFSRYHS